MVSSGDLRAPQFNGQNYEYWAVKMKTILIAYDLWDIVECGDTSTQASKENESGETSGSKDKKSESGETAAETKEKRIKDAKALSIIQGALTDDIFPRIRNEETARGAWNLTKFFGVINDLKSLGEEITREPSVVSDLETVVMLRIRRAHKAEAIQNCRIKTEGLQIGVKVEVLLISPLLMFEDKEEDAQNESVQLDTGESSQENLGLLHHFLGMGVLQNEESIFIHQSKYAKSLLEKFGLAECKPVSIPLAIGEKMVKDDGSEPADDNLYRKIVGSLLYLTATRPDIMYAASLLSRYMNQPTRRHMGVAKRVLRYVQGTLDYGIEYSKHKSETLKGFCDADWGGSEEDSRSTSGYAFGFGSGVCSWASIKQGTVALSTAEAEYVSASEATTQVMWLRSILDDLGEKQDKATSLYCDNMSAIAMAKNPVFHQKTRHINRRIHFIREAVQEGIIELKFCRSEEQLADIFTKALPKDRFVQLRSQLGVKPVSSLGGGVDA